MRDPYFDIDGPFEGPKSDEADLAERMFDDAERRRAREWAEAEGLGNLRSLEDQEHRSLPIAAE